MLEGMPDAAVRLPSPHLPPPDVRLFDPRRDQRIKTPLDERGLVDPHALIREVKKTVAPDYRWQSRFNDIHHLQWPNRHYARQPDEAVNPQEFRNTALTKLEVPRVFHNWTHLVTEPPPVPSDETMHHLIEAQRVADALFSTIRITKMISRLKHLDETRREDRLMQFFDKFNETLETTHKLPPEFQVVDLSDYRADSYEDMFQLAPQLGKLAITSTAVRQVTLPGAPVALPLAV